MNDRYYVFSKGRKRGPFSLDDLLDETERGQVEYEDLCLRIGATTCEKIREVLDWEDEPLIRTSEQQSDDVLPEQEADTLETHDSDKFEFADEGEVDHEDEETSDVEEDELEQEEEEESVDDFEEILPDEDFRGEEDIEDDDNDDDFTSEESPDEEDDDEFEEILEADEEEEQLEDDDYPTPAQNLPPRDSTAILYSGRPSLLSYPRSLLLAALSLGAGIWFRDQFDWILFAGIAIALITFVQAQLRRSRHQYFITRKQVEVIHGLILENSREVRIEDIGAIHIRQRGLQGLLGLASIEFAALESPMPVLVFYNVRSARRIKDLVRRLQDALEYPE